MDATEYPNDITIMILNHKDRSPQKLASTQQDIHIIAIIPPNTFWCVIEPQWPPYYNPLKLSLATIILLHNLDTPLLKHNFALQLWQTTQDKHNLNIPTHNPMTTIKPYKVNKSYERNITPKANFLNKIKHPHNPTTQILATSQHNSLLLFT